MRKLYVKQTAQLVMMWGLLALFTACAMKKPTAANPQPTTPFQQVMLWNEGLAQTNQDVAQAVIGMNKAQPPVIDVQTAQVILTLQFRIAAADKKLTGILEQGPAYATANSATINLLITDISGAANELTTTGLVGVKNEQSKANISGLITGLSGLSKLLVTGLTQAGVLR